MSLKHKDSPPLSGQTPVIAKFIGKNIVVGTRDGILVVFILKDGKYYQTRRVQGHNLTILSIAVPEDNSFVVTTSMEGKCLIFTPNETGLTFLREIQCKSTIFPHAAVSRDGKTIAIAGHKGIVLIERNGQLNQYNAGDDTIVDLTFYGPNDNQLILVGRHSITQFDLDSNVPINVLTLKGNDIKCHIHCVAANLSNQLVAVGTFNRFVEFYKFEGEPTKVGEVSIPHDRPGAMVKLIEMVEFTNDGRHLIVGSSNGSVSVIDVDNYTITETKKFQRSRIFSVCISADDSEVISVSDDKTIYCLELVQ
ncbi:hypothetical protein TVAG_275030 [Trichomonas vaginalis G3]|uniref:Uncharacterized protein n=1 Tax=Trichomonas vaginalis (strain ATCC PRA-98 / G3) TaxID=412133 RepID=A2FNW8_TRIV3|nr:WD40 repeat-like family [Trichomonas vaginalis G3]EAX93388.1 hypothetical protein TVAG_275030 [Trichomonas vaginalis G3]KAI5544418.1 WD40 repeat-like family [Trichomonas vaginalis G3]|eukprot:XP_001306318.1 hypothetical protein [Trichomonas vaginalis G3]